MSIRFEQCLTVILHWEGGYVDHPHDPGGATNKGITLHTYAAFRKHNDLPPPTKTDLQRIPATTVRDIYKARYWDAVKADSLPPGVDLMVFNAAVLSGPRQAAKTLQRAVGVDDDGIIGPITLGAVSNYPDQKGLVKKISKRRETFFRRIVALRPASRAFLRGWLNRLNDVIDTALVDLQWAC